MTELNPELIEKALREFVKPRMITNMALDGLRANLAAALSAVADDLRAEGVDSCASVHEADAEQCPDEDNCHQPELCRQMNLQVASALREHAAKLREADK